MDRIWKRHFLCRAGRGRGLRRLLLLGAALSSAAVLAPSPARGDDPLPWSSLLPGLTSGYEPTSQDICRSGRIQCVDAVIREMTRRFTPLASSCSHDAVFALLYLIVTQYYRADVTDPNFFSDNAFVNYEDAYFAQQYFSAFDNWYGGVRALVPRAWQIAFSAADAHAVSGAGNLLLGVNAHVNRDLPFVLAYIGLVKPDGTSRKPDHDKVNEVFYQAYGPAFAEAERRFDPSISNPTFDGMPYDDDAFLQTLVAWREEAWRNAERLVLAATPEERAQVAQSIEQAAASEAEAIVAATAYPPGQSSASRDAYCAVHWSGS
jgi:hypothetical protein